MKKIFVIFSVLVLASSLGQAQEVYFSISGADVQVKSGAQSEYYDFWIRPHEPGNAAVPQIEIYDAGLGGYADVVSGDANTKTEFLIGLFSSAYERDENRLTPLDNDFISLEQIEVVDENKYLNRWVPFFNPQGDAPNGWIVRVKAGSGNDVNNFKIRLIGVGAQNWEVFALNLSIGLYKSRPNTVYQLQAFAHESQPPKLLVEGEEDARVFIEDAFGLNLGIDKTENWIPEQYGMANSWALNISASTQFLNNLSVFGQEGLIIPWRVNGLHVPDQIDASVQFSHVQTAECLQQNLSVQAIGFGLDASNARWLLGEQLKQGASVTHRFGSGGQINVPVLIPTQARYSPRFLLKSTRLEINQAPTPVIRNTKNVISPAETLTLNAAESSDPDGNKLLFSWFINDEYRSSSKQLVFSSSVSGRYAVRLQLNDGMNSPCSIVEKNVEIVVNTQPYADIQMPEVVAPNTPFSVAAVEPFDSDNNPLSFSWDVVGSAVKAQGQNPNLSVEEPGIYTLRLTIDDGTQTQNASYTTERILKVNAQPKPNFAVAEMYAPSDPIRLDATRSQDPDGDALKYSWRFSDGRTFSEPRLSTDFEQAGTFEITLAVNDGTEVGNAIQELSRNIIINVAPVPLISAPEKVNTSLVRFDAGQSTDADQQIERFEWDFGDGKRGQGAQVEHQFASAGTYTVRLTVDDGTGMKNARQRVEHKIVVNSNPVADFSVPERVGPGTPFSLDAGESRDVDGDIAAAAWFVNGNPIGNGINITHQIEESGLYTVTLQVSDDSGFEQATDLRNRLIEVNFPPVPRWTVSPEMTEPGRTTVFDASGSSDEDDALLSYEWIFDDGEIFTGARINRTFAESGTNGFRLTVSDGQALSNSKTEKRGEFRVNSSPIIVTETELIQNDLTVTLDAEESYDPDGELLSYVWVLPDGSRQTAPRFKWTAPRPGVYTVTLTVDDGAGLDNSKVSSVVRVRINRPVVAVVDDFVESCTGQIIIFSSSRSYDPDGDTFSTRWNFGDGTSSLENNPYHSYDQPGRYYVSLELDDGIAAQATKAQIPVSVFGSPIAKLQVANSTVCINTPITFDARQSQDPNGPIGAYSWDYGDQQTGFGQEVTHLFSEPGIYEVVLTIIGNENGTCSNVSQDKVEITVVAGPEIDFSVPEWVNPGEEVILDVSHSKVPGGIKSVEWLIESNQGQPFVLDGSQVAWTAQNPGSYTVTARVEGEEASSCSRASLQKVFKVNAAPTLQWNAPDVVAQGTSILLSAQGSSDADGFIKSLVWKLDGKEIGRGLSVALPTTQAGSKELVLEAIDNSGIESGKSRLTKRIEISSGVRPDFSLPSQIYKGETINLEPSAAGSTSWLLDGEPLDESAFVAEKASHQITLIVDDGKGLPNSVDSLFKRVPIISMPELNLQLPEKMILGSQITAVEMGLSADFSFMQDGNKSKTWTALEVGRQNVDVIWHPKGEELNRITKTVNVLAPLEISKENLEQRVKWNPANRRVELGAPSTNRPKNVGLVFTWFAEGRLLTYGERVTLNVARGENFFQIEIQEQGVHGAKKMNVTLTVVAQ